MAALLEMVALLDGKGHCLRCVLERRGGKVENVIRLYICLRALPPTGAELASTTHDIECGHGHDR
jgi:hypothetical protein